MSQRYEEQKLSERELENLLKQAVDSRNLNLAGYNLSGETAFLIADTLTSNRLFKYISHVNISNTGINSTGFEHILNVALQCEQLVSFTAKDNRYLLFFLLFSSTCSDDTYYFVVSPKSGQISWTINFKTPRREGRFKIAGS